VLLVVVEVTGAKLVDHGDQGERDHHPYNECDLADAAD